MTAETRRLLSQGAMDARGAGSRRTPRWLVEPWVRPASLPEGPRTEKRLETALPAPWRALLPLRSPGGGAGDKGFRRRGSFNSRDVSLRPFLPVREQLR